MKLSSLPLLPEQPRHLRYFLSGKYIQEYRDKGYTYEEIAQSYGCHPDKCARILKNYKRNVARLEESRQRETQ